MTALPPLISSDGHLEVRPERWTPRMPAKLRDKAPRTIKLPDGGDALLVEGQPPYPAPVPRPPRRPDQRDLAAVRRDGRRHGRRRAARAAPAASRTWTGCYAEVLFPNMQVGPRLWRTMADDDVYRAAVRAYNDWLGEEYCAVSRDRLIGLGVIPWTNVDDAIAELEHCAKLGLKGVNLGVFPSGKAYPTPEDDRFWAAAHRHEDAADGPRRLRPARARARRSRPSSIRGADPAMLAKARAAEASSSGWRCRSWASPPSMSLAQLILSGVFDRLPDLKIFFAETRLGWVPFWMEEADYWYERHRHWAERLLNFKPLKQRPERLRAPAHLLQRAARGAGGRRAAPPHGRGPHHVRHRLPAHRVRLAQHAAVRRAALRRRAGRRGVQDRGGNMLGFFHLRDTPVGRKALAAETRTA